MKKVQLNKSLTITAVVSLIFIGIIIFSMLSQNREIQNLATTQDTRLMPYEALKLAVIDEVNRYLGVIDESTWISARDKANMTADCLQRVYHSTFKEFTVPNLTSYTIVDCQYTIDDPEDISVYVEVATDTGSAVHFIYSLENTTENTVIYNVTAF